MAVFSIPGNIKQMHLPFVLNPSNPLNQVKQIEAKNVTGQPQVFSFRTSANSAGRLNICPSSIRTALTHDISYKLIYGPNKSTTININTIFNSIPGIQIREFLPDTRLDQILDFFAKIMDNVVSLFKASNSTTQTATQTGGETKIDDSILERIKRTCTFAVKYITGFIPNKNLFTSFSNVEKFKNIQEHGDITTYIYKFPYIMWYMLQSCTTTNIYELPCVVESKEMYSSDGTQGWPSAGFSLGNSFLNNIPLVKQLLNNVNISFMPWWDAKEGNATPTPPVVVKFDLFNDTANAALYNFIFVNTLIPNAKWVQYNLFQHSPHLYDIKLEGYGRLFACSAQFKVTQQGVLREMQNEWLEKKLKPYINESAMNPGDFINSIKKDKLIKIPDIYHVEMTFTSLLPDTFNNYLYTYSHNASITKGEVKVRQQSAAIDALTKGITSMATDVKAVWDGKLNDDGQKVK